MSFAISASRLWQSLEAYAQIGGTTAGGVHRPVFSDADLAARARIMADCAALGLAVRLDAAANVFATRPGAAAGLPSILIGSHLDSVPDGGRFDGPLGVLCAFEVLNSLVEHKVPTRHPITLVSFTGEEATSFGTSTFGSRALAGRLPDVGSNVLPDGRTVRQALHEAGGDWDQIGQTRAALGPVACFLEVHIEQGTRLERLELPLAVVSTISGIARQRVTFRGEQGHAGTVAMADRHDALRAAAHFILAIAGLPEHLAGVDPFATATVGALTVTPNSPNVIAGQVQVITDLRSSDAAALARLAGMARDAAEAAASTASVAVAVEPVLDQAPVTFDVQVHEILADVLTPLQGSAPVLPSLAGHDAAHLQSLAPAGMLFVRCTGGISHRADEAVTPEDAAQAAQALLDAVLALDAQLLVQCSL